MNSVNKLSVGIILESSYQPTTGGGYTYYDTIIQYIDKYSFHESLNIYFINVGNKEVKDFQKKIIRINPDTYFTTKDRLRKKVTNLLAHRFIRALRLFGKVQSKLSQSNRVVFNKYTERGLAENQIDLLYYLVPGHCDLNYPYIMTHWDIGHLSMYSFPEVSMNNTFENREQYFCSSLKKAFAIFAESNAGKRELVHYTGINPERISVVPLFPGNVIHLNVPIAEQSEILDQYNLKTREFFFYPAQFWSHKNHYNLLYSFKNLLERAPYLRLVFSGSDKGNLQYIKGIIKELQLEKEVVITGFVTYEALFTLYKNAIALVMPTFLGPTNIPLLEAQAIGCPVICSDFEGHREMLGQNATYINPEDQESIYEAMRKSLVSPIQQEPVINPVFNIQNAVHQMEKNLLAIKSRRKTFGYNYLQF